LRIAIVNDVMLAREVLKRFLRDETHHELAWSAEDGAEAVARAATDTPDLILMDLVMPNMDGVEATRRIMRDSPTAILIVTASVDRLTSKVFEALGAGALDAVNTPVLGGAEHSGISTLGVKIQTIERLVGGKPRSVAPAVAPSVAHSHVPLVAVGASSGGPAALASILSALPSDFPACLCIVQHIDSAFIKGLVDWLGGQTKLEMRVAQEGDVLRQGVVYLAGTDRHLVMEKNLTLGYNDNPKDSIHRPSIDVFFNSLSTVWPARGVGVILTGMGSDGANGLVALRKSGFYTLAQDEASSSIYGMPKVAAERGGADKIVSLVDIPGSIMGYLAENRRAARKLLR
jgi:two-component system response regulator WspF